MSYHQRNPSNNIQLLRPVESNSQHTSRPPSGSMASSDHGHNNSQMFVPFAIDSSRGPEFRYVHQGTYTPSSYRDIQYISPQQVSQIEIHRSGPLVSVPNSLSVSYRSSTDTMSSRPRMSLLHGNEFVQYRTHHLPHLASTDNLSQTGLRIETRDLSSSISSGAYHPMVEAISPTGEESNAEELGNAKNELITHMNKLDSEISETEKTISMLKKKKAMLEETASYKLESSNVETNELQPKHRSLAQKIYAENRKKALAAHAILSSLGASTDYPMYNQPRDAQICQTIIEKHKSFKEKLIQHLRAKKLQNARDQQETAEKYSLLSQEWNKKVEKLESTIKRKTKEAKNREFFEKVFPELRKQREDKERFNRVGSRIKSEADVEEIIDGLQEQAMEDKKMRSYAVIPPLMLNSDKKRCFFKNENGALVDMEAEFKERQNINVWTNGEKETFREKFLQHPKNFGAIAASLDRKNAQDCVRYYYLSKKTENYKQLLRKSRQRTRSSKNPQKSNHTLTPSIIDAMTTGVLTRLQREQQQKTGTRDRTSSTIRTVNLCSNVSGSSSINENVNNTNFEGGCEVIDSVNTSKGSEIFPIVTDRDNEGASPNSPSPKNEVVKSTVISSTISNNSEKNENVSDSSEIKTKENWKTEDVDTGSIEDREALKKEINLSAKLVDYGNIKRRRLETETSDSETSGLVKENISTHPCFICKAETCLRTKPIEKGSIYGLNDDEIPENARVCQPCQSKSVKSRYTTCPLPTCANPKDRLKHFRNIPSKLFELPSESKNAIIEEFQIAPDINKCCSVCLMKIRRKINYFIHMVPLNEDQVSKLKAFLKENGPKWMQISEQLCKPTIAIKSFFQINKTNHGLDNALKEYYEKHPNENKHLDLSDGEESDMSASSSDERDINSDTASAESPGNQNNKENTNLSTQDLMKIEKDNRLIPPLNQPPKRQKTQEEYDSSATETADEENESSPANRQSPKVINHPFSALPNGPRIEFIIGNVIEKAIKDQSIGLPPPAPESKSEITFVKEFRNDTPRSRNQKCDNMPTISIVNLPEKSPQLNQVQKNSFISTTITPINQKGFFSNTSMKIDTEPQTLDLSVKRPVRDHFATPGQMNSQSGITIYRNDTSSGSLSGSQSLPTQNQNFTPFLHDVGRSSKSPSGFQPLPVPLSPTQQHNLCSVKSIPHPLSQTPPPLKNKISQKLSPKSTHNQQHLNIKGSITHGTPVSSSAVMISSVSSPSSRYDSIFRQTPPGEKSGSITQGTPVPMGHSQFSDKRLYDYYKNNRQSPASNISSQSGSPQSGNFGNLYNRSTTYIDHPQLSSKQILLNDYITSQQMIGRGSRSDKEVSRGCHSISTSPATIFYSEKDRNRPDYMKTPPTDRNSVLSPHRTSPTQRQETTENMRRSHPIKVIQRHNTSMAKPPSPVSSRMHYPQSSFPPGHEAFSSLVDVASKQPYVPTKDDKRTNVPLISIDQPGEDLRYQMVIQTAMQRHHMQQQIQMQQQSTQQQQHHQQRIHQQQKNKYFPDIEKDRREDENARERERVQQHIEREKDRERMHLVDMERNMLIEKEYERQRLKAEENERIKYVRPNDTERPFRPQISSRGDTTFTAANLINAIVTHQISQNMSNVDQPLSRDTNRNSQIPAGRGTSPIDNNGKRGSPNVINIDVDPSNTQHISNQVTKIKLGDLAESIITKDYSPSPLHPIRPNFSQEFQPGLFSEQWKQSKRVSIQKDEVQHPNADEMGNLSEERQIVKMSQTPSPRQRHNFHEPVSPPDSQTYAVDKRVPMHPPSSQEFALDCYVKSRIAEAMRTEGDKRMDDRNQKIHTQDPESQNIVSGTHSGKTEHSSNVPLTSYAPTAYAYPYSALNISGGNTLLSPKQDAVQEQDALQSKNLTSGPLTSHTSQVTEPKPLLSAQYEALSDED